MKKMFNNSTIFVFHMFLKHAKFYAILRLTNVILQRISYVLLLQYSLLTIIDHIETGTSFKNVIGIVIFFFLLSIIITFVDNLLTLYYEPKIYEKLSCILQLQTFQCAKQVEMHCFDDHEFYERYNHVMLSADSKIFEMFNNVISIIANCTSILALASLFITLSPLALIFVLLPFLFSLINNIKTSKLEYDVSKQIIDNNRKRDYVNRVIYDTTYVKEIKVNHVTGLLLKMMQETFQKSSKIYVSYYKKMRFHKQTVPFIIDLVFGKFIYISLLIYQVVTLETLSIGGFSALFFASGSITDSLLSLRCSLMEHAEISRVIYEIISFFDIKTEVSYKIYENITPQNIQIKHLDFTYRQTETKILDDLSLNLTIGKKIAIVGANGAGKTTFIKLLLGLYTPQNGEVLLGNEPIGNIDFNTYISMFGTVFQDYNIYALTVLENVIMDKVPESHYKELSKKVYQILERINLNIEDKLEDCLKTRLLREFSNEDTRLSGGQEQKIAIARVLFGNKPYIILDEPSSSLDPEAEFDFNNIINEYAKDNTVIMISHRLSTTKNADIIYVFDKGRIAESGSHDLLMELNGLYSKMYTIQASKYWD